MLEKINTAGFESISKPSLDALEVLKRLLAEKDNISIAEIGVGIGATSIEILKLLGGNGTFHIFDFNDRVSDLARDLKASEYIGDVSIIEHGNSRKTFDSYAWSLSNIAIANRDSGTPTEIFDFVYHDGAHAFQHDAPACVILKEMIRPGGYIVFDDMYWSFEKSPSMNSTKNPDIKKDYSDEQLSTPHVEVVVKLFIETDSRFEQVYLTENRKPYRPVFRRIA